MSVSSRFCDCTIFSFESSYPSARMRATHNCFLLHCDQSKTQRTNCIKIQSCSPAQSLTVCTTVGFYLGEGSLVMLYVYPLLCSCCHCDGISYLRINCLQFPVFLSSSAENWAQRLCVNLATKRVGSSLAEAVAQKTNLNARLLWPLWLRTGLLSSCTKFQCLYVNLFCLFAHTQCANHHKAEMTLAEFIRHA